jgi:hypothetical protein
MLNRHGERESVRKSPQIGASQALTEHKLLTYMKIFASRHFFTVSRPTAKNPLYFNAVRGEAVFAPGVGVSVDEGEVRIGRVSLLCNSFRNIIQSGYVHNNCYSALDSTT